MATATPQQTAGGNGRPSATISKKRYAELEEALRREAAALRRTESDDALVAAMLALFRRVTGFDPSASSYGPAQLLATQNWRKKRAATLNISSYQVQGGNAAYLKRKAKKDAQAAAAPPRPACAL